ncbi:MAG TPA: hypothetical protein VMV46_07155 [Thermoanaerobaculia bacterium]|nr:hypothetical protein [Thermoanaerobaculia bacterium]
MSNFALYVVGFLVLIAGLAWGAHILGVAPVWIGVGTLVLTGIAIVTGVSKTRYREPSPEDRGTGRVVIEDEG